MGNVKPLVVILCAFLLSLPSWCEAGDNGGGNSPESMEEEATSNDKSVTEAINTKGGLSGAVIGVSVVAGFLLATIIVIVIIFLLWRRKILALLLKSMADREAAPTPQKQKWDNPSEGVYTEPYASVRLPDILENKNESNDNHYAEVKKDRKKHPLVSGSSLYIEENDLYSGSGDGAP